MRLASCFLALLILQVAGQLGAQGPPAPVISNFTVRPASGQPDVRIGDDAIMEFEYAHVAGGFAKTIVEVELCVAGTKICFPSTDWKLSESDLAKYPDDSGKVILRRRTTGTRNQDLLYELRLTDAQGRKASAKTTEPLRLRVR